MEQQKEKISPEELRELTKRGLNVLKLPKSEGVNEEVAKFRISRSNTNSKEEFVEIFTENELIEMLEIIKII